LSLARSQAEELLIRPVSDADAAGLIELIGTIWRSYPGIIFDVDAELPELRALASAFAHAGGAGWVAERTGRIVGCVGVAPSRSSADWEILKLYVTGTGGVRASPASWSRWRRIGPAGTAQGASSCGPTPASPRRMPFTGRWAMSRKAGGSSRT
jgi:hypothetical protein